ncbi:MAG TPA: MFS transporter [Acidimicrobiales bacterium]|nr:MFS transporter [Acidimicrobiales bacterium]
MDTTASTVFQQITRVKTRHLLPPTLLHSAGLGNSASLLANVGNGAVNVALTMAAIGLIDRVGRRVLLIGARLEWPLQCSPWR